MNLFQVKNEKDDFGWGAVINFQKKANQSKVSFICVALFFYVHVNSRKKGISRCTDNFDLFQTPSGAESSYVVEVLLNLSRETSRSKDVNTIKPCPKGEKGEMQVRLPDYTDFLSLLAVEASFMI